MKNLQGSTLLFTLVLIGIAGALTTFLMETSLLEIRTSRNYVSRELQLTFAENHLKTIQHWLDALPQYIPPTAEKCNQLCIQIFEAIPKTNFQDPTWWKIHGLFLNTEENQSAFVLIRELAVEKDEKQHPLLAYYQVLLFSLEADNQAILLLQATFLKRFQGRSELKPLSWAEIY